LCVAAIDPCRSHLLQTDLHQPCRRSLVNESSKLFHVTLGQRVPRARITYCRVNIMLPSFVAHCQSIRLSFVRVRCTSGLD
jgi:hypothetical protein